MLKQVTATMALAIALAGCATLQFGEHQPGNPDGMIHYEPVPHVVRTCSDKGAPVLNVVMIPNPEHAYYVRPGQGYGGSKQSATVTNGILTTFTQESDPQMQHLGSLLTAVAALQTDGCEPRLYRIVGGQTAISLVEVDIPTERRPAAQ